MYCRRILNFIIKCIISVYHGFIEFCDKGCIVGSQYLVKPNYHSSERRLWSLIFTISTICSLMLINHYLNNYSKNVYRTVVEKHSVDRPFNYPTLGLCEVGFDEWFVKVEHILENSIYLKYPLLKTKKKLRNFLFQLTYPRPYKKEDDFIEKFVNYTNTLSSDIKDYLENYNYMELSNMITSKCDEFFVECFWLENPISCCKYFKEIPTMSGRCFVFNSAQIEENPASVLIANMTKYTEPYRLKLSFTKQAMIFLLNNKDIPEFITPIPIYIILKSGTRVNIEFNIRPMVNDESILDLDEDIIRCYANKTAKTRISENYLHKSYSTCITDYIFKIQRKKCNCTKLYSAKPNAKYCTLSQYACLEKLGYINPKFITLDVSHCLPTCDDSEYMIENLYHSTDKKLKQLRSLELILLNYPTTNTHRQAIRQIEDKIVSISGILGLFVGVSLITAVEFIYLVGCAFWKQKINVPANERVRAIEVRGNHPIVAHP